MRRGQKEGQRSQKRDDLYCRTVTGSLSGGLGSRVHEKGGRWGAKENLSSGEGAISNGGKVVENGAASAASWKKNVAVLGDQEAKEGDRQNRKAQS